MMHKPIILRLLVSIALITPAAFGRAQLDPAMINIPRDLLPTATTIFRGRVALVRSDSAANNFVAVFEPDRWYRGSPIPVPEVPFAYSRDGDIFVQGHNCIDFQPNTYWIVFAKLNDSGQFELVHDCHGALPVSSRIAQTQTSKDAMTQMEADFEAGLDDGDPAAQHASILRLGNLRSPAAQPALRRMLANCSQSEKVWVVMAAVYSGDISSLPEAAAILSKPGRDEHQGTLAIALQEITDRSAVPDLIGILRSAPELLTKDVALKLLGDKLHDVRALPDIASYLGNSDQYLNWDALVGVWQITHAPACSLQGWKEEDVPAITQTCKSWWESVGRLQNWPR